MHYRRLFTRLLASLLLLTQIACGSATGSRIWVTEKGHDRLTDHVSPVDHLYLLLNGGGSLEGEVEAVRDVDIVVDGYRLELGEIQKIQMLARSDSGGDGKTWEKVALAFIAALATVVLIAGSRGHPGYPTLGTR